MGSTELSGRKLPWASAPQGPAEHAGRVGGGAGVRRKACGPPAAGAWESRGLVSERPAPVSRTNDQTLDVGFVCAMKTGPSVGVWREGVCGLTTEPDGEEGAVTVVLALSLGSRPSPLTGSPGLHWCLHIKGWAGPAEVGWVPPLTRSPLGQPFLSPAPSSSGWHLTFGTRAQGPAGGGVSPPSLVPGREESARILVSVPG